MTPSETLQSHSDRVRDVVVPQHEGEDARPSIAMAISRMRADLANASSALSSGDNVAIRRMSNHLRGYVVDVRRAQ